MKKFIEIDLYLLGRGLYWLALIIAFAAGATLVRYGIDALRSLP